PGPLHLGARPGRQPVRRGGRHLVVRRLQREQGRRVLRRRLHVPRAARRVRRVSTAAGHRRGRAAEPPRPRLPGATRARRAPDGALNIDASVRAWGFVDDKAASGGHLYSSKAPGTSFLGVPVLWVQTRLWHAAGWPSPSKRAATLALRFFSVMPCVLLFLFVFA